jgi:hypothetical protein
MSAMKDYCIRCGCDLPYGGWVCDDCCVNPILRNFNDNALTPIVRKKNESNTHIESEINK